MSELKTPCVTEKKEGSGHLASSCSVIARASQAGWVEPKEKREDLSQQKKKMKEEERGFRESKSSLGVGRGRKELSNGMERYFRNLGWFDKPRPLVGQRGKRKRRHTGSSSTKRGDEKVKPPTPLQEVVTAQSDKKEAKCAEIKVV